MIAMVAIDDLLNVLLINLFCAFLVKYIIPNFYLLAKLLVSTIFYIISNQLNVKSLVMKLLLQTKKSVQEF